MKNSEFTVHVLYIGNIISKIINLLNYVRRVQWLSALLEIKRSIGPFKQIFYCKIVFFFLSISLNMRSKEPSI